MFGSKADPTDHLNAARVGGGLSLTEAPGRRGLKQLSHPNETTEEDMPRPPAPLIVKWRDLAEEGLTYAEIARRHLEYSVDQVRHYCLGNTGRKLPGPLQRPNRWGGRNIWLQGERGPHVLLSREQAIAILDDWDEAAANWETPGAEWARRLGASASTIHMLRRGETWKHLEHPNQGRRKGKPGR